MSDLDKKIYELVFLHWPHKTIANRLGIAVADVRCRAKAMGISPAGARVPLSVVIANLAANKK